MAKRLWPGPGLLAIPMPGGCPSEGALAVVWPTRSVECSAPAAPRTRDGATSDGPCRGCCCGAGGISDATLMKWRIGMAPPSKPVPELRIRSDKGGEPGEQEPLRLSWGGETGGELERRPGLCGVAGSLKRAGWDTAICRVAANEDFPTIRWAGPSPPQPPQPAWQSPLRT